MNKYIISKFIGLLTLTLFVASCANDGEEVAAIVDTNKPTLTTVVSSAITAAEGTEIPITFNLTAPVAKAFNLYVVVLPNSTANGDDSDVSESYQNNAFQKTITIPPFVTTFTTSILINSDVTAEEVENLILSIGDTRTTAVLFVPALVNVTIQNVVSDELNLKFNFDKTFGANGYSNSLCEIVSDISGDGYDVDFIIYDADLNPVSYPGAFGAQTGACTEELTIKLEDYPDGTYFITAFLYTNAELDLAGFSFPLLGIAQFDIPITVDYSRAGSINGTYTQESANFYNSNTPVETENYVMSIVIATDAAGKRTFSIQNSEGLVSATGKKALKFNHVKRIKN